MSKIDDRIDSLLFSFAKGQRRVVLKSRQVGKTAMMDAMKQQLKSVPFDLHYAQKVAFDDLNAAYDSAMKSNSNSYLGTPPFTATGPTIQLSNIDAVIRSAILPDCVSDVAGTGDFDSWTWHGFVDGVSKKVGIVSARHISTNTYCQHKFYLVRSLVDGIIGRSRSFEVDRLLVVVDQQIMQGVSDIVASVLPPHDINACTDPECPC